MLEKVLSVPKNPQLRAATERKRVTFLFVNPLSNAPKEIKCDESDTESSSDEETDDLEE